MSFYPQLFHYVFIEQYIKNIRPCLGIAHDCDLLMGSKYIATVENKVKGALLCLKGERRITLPSQLSSRVHLGDNLLLAQACYPV
ncbi:MAG: hypothetical protein ACJAVI_003974 [Candidatus Azotimanducaceae bacterium]|jgi:hypothetical protein